MRLPPAPKKFDRLAMLMDLVQDNVVPLWIVPHCKAVPLGVLVRILLDRILDGEALRALMEEFAPRQYTRAVAIEALLRLMLQVSAGSRASLFAAYQADQACDDPTLKVTAQAVYQKLQRIEPGLTEAIVRYSYTQMKPLLEALPRTGLPLLPGYRIRILDGNVLTKTEHRLKPLRKKANGCLPGKSVVVYDPDLGLVVDLVLAEDAYTQERVLARELLPSVQAKDLWIADRHFCTAPFTLGVQRAGGFFLVRQHQNNLPVTPVTELRACGETATGKLYEQEVHVVDAGTGATTELRRIEIHLFEKTRDGDVVLGLLTNLPKKIKAEVIAGLYLKRWRIETLFQFLTESLHCEVPSLGHPRAALFAFGSALVASNALAAVRASLRAAHGGKAEAEVSGYYLADEIGNDYRALVKYVPADQWQGWKQLSTADLVRVMTALAAQVNLRALQRHVRGPKKPPPKRFFERRHSHYSTYRLLNEDKKTC